MSEIAKKSVETFAFRLTIQLFNAGGAIVIARVLGAPGKGLFTYAVTVIGLVVMATAGQSSAILWQYGKRGRSPAALLRAMRLILMAVALPLAVGLGLAGVLIPGQHALLAVAAALPFALYVQSAAGFFLADSDVRTPNLQQMFPTVLAVITYVPLLLFAHAGVGVLLAVWAAGYAGSAIFTAFSLRRYERVAVANDDVPAVAKEQIWYGGQVCLNGLVSYLNFRIDVFLIMFMLGQSALGIYSIGIGIGEMLWQLSRPMTTASLGRIARGTEAEAAKATAKCMRYSFAMVLVAAIAVFLLAPILVPLVYGHTFAYAAVVTRALLPGIIAYSMMPTLATFFAQQLGQPRIPLLFSAISMTLCAVTTALTLPHFGIIGGAIATSISYVVAFSAAAVYFVRRTHIAPLQLFALSRSDLRPYRAMISKILSPAA